MLAVYQTPCYNKGVTSVGCFYFLNKLPLFWMPCACDKVDRKQDGGILLGEAMKTIPLTQNMFTVVDDGDYEWLSQWKWQAKKTKWGFYATRKVKKNGIQHTVHMHRLIIEAPDKYEVDHKDRNGLNNTRANIRIATRPQNMHNIGLPKHNKTGYKGVSFDKNRNKYQACIQVNGKSIGLGRFSTAIEAAKEYDVAAEKYYGEFASKNIKQKG